MNPTVSQILDDRGIKARPGRRVECPFCHHKTFSIRGDDTLGKCFHPACARIITPFHHEKNRGLAGILEEVFHDWHQYLLFLKDLSGSNAYKYLVQERLIHSQIIEDAMLGAVPVDYNTHEKFGPLEEELAEAVEAEEAERKNKRGKPKNGGMSSRDKLSRILEAEKKLNQAMKIGWIAFFYTDPYHRISSIRFRRPYDKSFTSIFFWRDAGLFGRELFSETSDTDINSLLIVAEGEFNILSLQSLAVRNNLKYVNACAVGGVMTADCEAVKKVTRRPIIAYDNDENEAGLGLIERFQKSMNIRAFTTPGQDSDLDSFIQRYGMDYAGAWEGVKGLLANHEIFLREYEEIAKEIYSTRQKTGPKEFEINTKVAEVIREDLKDRGTFYNDGESAYHFLDDQKKLFLIDPENLECSLLLSHYGVLSSENLFKYIIAALKVEAFSSEKTAIYRVSHYDPQAFTVYLSNHDNGIYRISPEGIDLVDNGTDGILFLSNPSYEPFEILDSPQTGALDEQIFSPIDFAHDTITPDERRYVLRLWFMGVFFASIMPTKAIPAFVGPKGSRKSITIRKMGVVLFGSKFNVTILPKEVKDFDAIATHSYFLAIDNADTYRDWFEDRLATLATGANISLRELYTTNDMREMPMNRCFVAISSRTPKFKRDDVVDRLLIMKVEPIKRDEESEGFTSENILIEELKRNRNQIMTEIVDELREITRALKASAGMIDKSCFRMADFADFALKVARYRGEEERLKEIFRKLSSEQSTFTLEDDPVFDLLSEWVKKTREVSDGLYGSRKIFNSEYFISYKDLCLEIAILAEEKKIDFPYKGKPRNFSNKMIHLRANLENFFEITQNIGHSRKNEWRFVARANGESGESGESTGFDRFTVVK